MTDPTLLGALGHLQELLRELVRGLPADVVNRPLDPRLGCAGWQLGEAVYRETYWLREVPGGEDDLTARVRHLFDDPTVEPSATCAELPPVEHLLHWAEEIQHENLRRLATPGALPAHPLLSDDRLAWHLTQMHARTFERLLALKRLHHLAQASADYRVRAPIAPAIPSGPGVLVTQGHYRVGARNDPRALDNELPPQAVVLGSFRIAREPVTNAEYLAFMEASDAAGSDRTPFAWRRDASGAWYEIGVNGPCDLIPDQPVGGLSRDDANAHAAWVASLGGDRAGAVVQHEYQWEVAARGGHLSGIGQVWEWCANPFHPYPEFSPFPDARSAQNDFERNHGVQRGASLFTQPCLRRASYRRDEPPDSRIHGAGLRLVFPP